MHTMQSVIINIYINMHGILPETFTKTTINMNTNININVGMGLCIYLIVRTDLRTDTYL